MNKKALILGIQGQDGALLADFLLKKGYEVYGGARNLENYNSWRLIHLGILNQIKLFKYEIGLKEELRSIITKVEPNEIYLLSGDSKTYESFLNPLQSITSSVSSLTNLLDLCYELLPATRIFIAGSSEMFGSFESGKSSDDFRVVTEDSLCNPSNPYGVGKLNNFHLSRLYRIYHNLYIVNGILFNHESHLRSKHFVTRKITRNLTKLKLNLDGGFTLGNIDMQRDWTSASDVVRGMHLSLQPNIPSDYIFSSGIKTSVRDFFMIAAKSCGFEPLFFGEGLNEYCKCIKTGKKLLSINPRHFRVIDTIPLVGDSSKANDLLKWFPLVSLETLIGEMVENDMLKWTTNQNTH